jgi:membrane protein implicated in regulation of membrane protease activity
LAAAVTQSLFALAMMAVGATVIILTLPKNPLVARLTLKRELSANATDPATTHDLVGRRGLARSALRPGGTIDVDGQSLSAVSEQGEFVPAGTAVEVVAFSLGEAVVRPVTAGGA